MTKILLFPARVWLSVKELMHKPTDPPPPAPHPPRPQLVEDEE